MLVVLLFAIMLLFMFMRVYLPIGAKVSGKVQKIVSLHMQERAILQRANVYSIGFVLLIMTVTGVLPSYAEIGVVLIALMILALPVRLMFTAEGIALNNVVFRPWSDFTSFTLEKRRIVLNGKQGTRPFNLALLATHQQEILPILRRHMSEAKAGKSTAGRRRAIAG